MLIRAKLDYPYSHARAYTGRGPNVVCLTGVRRSGKIDVRRPYYSAHRAVRWRRTSLARFGRLLEYRDRRVVRRPSYEVVVETELSRSKRATDDDVSGRQEKKK